MEKLENYNLVYLVFLVGEIPVLEMNLGVKSKKYNSILMSGFLSALKSFSQKVSNRDLKVIDQGDLKICVEESELVSAFFVTRSISEGLKKKIRDLLESFEYRYRENINENDIEISQFEPFKEVIMNSLSCDIIRNYYIVKTTGKTPIETMPNEIWPVLSKINGNRTVKDISRKIGLDLDATKKIIGFLRAKDLVSFLIYINPFDIPVLSAKGVGNLLSNSEDYLQLINKIGEDQLKVVKLIDGKSTVKELASKCSLDPVELSKIMDVLLDKEYIDILEEEMRFCLIFERLYVLFTKALEKKLKKKGPKIFYEIINQSQNPLVKMIRIDKDYNISFELVNMNVKNQKDLSIRELLEILCNPIIKTFDVLRSAMATLSSKMIDDLQKELFLDSINDLRNIFGSKNLDQLAVILGIDNK